MNLLAPNIEVLIILETKFLHSVRDPSPISQFLIDGFSSLLILVLIALG